jgi:hypothetical protein
MQETMTATLGKHGGGVQTLQAEENARLFSEKHAHQSERSALRTESKGNALSYPSRQTPLQCMQVANNLCWRSTAWALAAHTHGGNSYSHSETMKLIEFMCGDQRVQLSERVN